MDISIDDYFEDSVIDDAIVGLSEKEYKDQNKCVLCGRKLHFRNALIVDDFDGMTVAGKRCGCCGAVYLKVSIIRALSIACKPNNIKMNYMKTVRYENFIPTKVFNSFIKRKDILFTKGKHYPHLLNNEIAKASGKSNSYSNTIVEQEETVKW